MRNVEIAKEGEKKQSHSSISVVTIGVLLILGQHSSVCTAKA